MRKTNDDSVYENFIKIEIDVMHEAFDDVWFTEREEAFGRDLSSRTAGMMHQWEDEALYWFRLARCWRGRGEIMVQRVSNVAAGKLSRFLDYAPQHDDSEFLERRAFDFGNIKDDIKVCVAFFREALEKLGPQYDGIDKA